MNVFVLYKGTSWQRCVLHSTMLTWYLLFVPPAREASKVVRLKQLI